MIAGARRPNRRHYIGARACPFGVTTPVTCGVTTICYRPARSRPLRQQASGRCASGGPMPRAPKKCGNPSCEERVIGRIYCAAHEPPAWAGSNRGSTRAWRTLRAQVLREEPRCACGAPSAEAGHIIAKADGGPDSRANLTGQCARCNREQNLRDQKRRRRPASPAGRSTTGR